MKRTRTTATNPGTGVNATTSTGVVVAARADRNYLRITNASDTVVYLRLAATAATVGTGVYLAAAGGYFEIEGYAGAVSAIHGGTGSKVLTVVEV